MLHPFHDGRFKVGATITDGNGVQRSANSCKWINQHVGLLSFFDPSNPDLLVKILDGRALNGYFWVMVGSLVSLPGEITVTDTVRGETKRYELGDERPPIKDWQAFGYTPRID